MNLQHFRGGQIAILGDGEEGDQEFFQHAFGDSNTQSTTSMDLDEDEILRRKQRAELMIIDEDFAQQVHNDINFETQPPAPPPIIPDVPQYFEPRFGIFFVF